LVTASLVDQVGNWSFSVVIVVTVYDQTHSPLWVAGLSAARWGTRLLLSGYAGVIADRYERIRVMLLSALASGVVMALMAVAVGLASPPWILLALTVLSAAAASPYQSAAGALTSLIVSEKDLAAANGLFATLDSVVVVLGPAIGGLVLLAGSPAAGVAANAVSFFVAAAIVVRLRIRSRGAADTSNSVVSEWLTGIRALGAQRVALTMVGFCALDSMVYGASTVIYAPLSVRLGTGVNGYSYLLAGCAAGGVLAAAAANRLAALPRLAPVITASIIIQAVPFAVTAWVHSAAPAFALQVISGVGMVVVDVLALTALQRDLDNAVLGRVLGAFEAVLTAAIMLGSFLSAAVLSAYGVPAVLLVVGIGAPALALLGLPLLVRGDRLSAAEVARLAPDIELLGRLDLFADAGRPVLERLAKSAERRLLPAGVDIIRQGDPADSLWILAVGSLAVRADTDTGVRELPTVSAPGYVGELGLVRGVPRTATVTTASECQLLCIDGARFLSTVESAPPSTSFITLAGARWDRTAPSLGSG
jgi:MFS family permease